MTRMAGETFLRTWLILGPSSSAARAFAHRAASSGARIILAGRDAEDLQAQAQDLSLRYGVPALARPFDALDLSTHPAFAVECVALSDGQLNLFAAVGIMPEQEALDHDRSLLRQTVDTNFTGLVSVLAAFTPALESQRGGTVMVMGSVAGDRGRPRNYLYGATKAALHTWLQGYAARLSRSGVRVVCIKAGVIDTAMTWALPKLPFMAGPEAFARSAWALTERGPQGAYVPRIWQLVMLAIRNVPTPIFNKMNL